MEFDDIIEIVRALQLATKLEERERLATLLFHRIRGRLLVSILGKVYPSEVDGVMSDVLKAIFTGIGKCEAKSSEGFFGWCGIIIRNKAIDQRRRRKPTEDLSNLDEIEGLIAASVERVRPTPEEKEVLDYVMSILKIVKPECFDVLWEHYMDELSVKWLAEQLGLEYDTMLRRIQRCITLARKILGNRGLLGE